jgi:general secretion pathway protein K
LPDKSILDQIWQFPFAWPPLLLGVTNSQTKSGIDKVVKQSGMQSKYIATIESEGNKIDINDLASPSKAIAQAVHTQLLQLFASKIKSDEAFAAEYNSYDFEKLINNITDWISDSPTSIANGGDKKARYSNLKSEFIPPGQPFKTLSELHMVNDMKDDFFRVLAPNITVFGDKAVNVNLATKEILMSLSPQITPERATEILRLKSLPTRGPFKDQKDFLSVLTTVGISGDPFTDPKTGQTVPLSFDSEFNFRIKSTGMSGKVSRTIEAVVYDYGRVKAGLQTAMETEKQAAQKQQSGTPTPAPIPVGGVAPSPSTSPSPNTQNQKIDVPNERPHVIYWEEN